MTFQYLLNLVPLNVQTRLLDDVMKINWWVGDWWCHIMSQHLVNQNGLPWHSCPICPQNKNKNIFCHSLALPIYLRFIHWQRDNHMIVPAKQPWKILKKNYSHWRAIYYWFDQIKNNTNQNMTMHGVNFDGLVQNCSISIACALEILQSCTKPSIWSWAVWYITSGHNVIASINSSWASMLIIKGLV